MGPSWLIEIHERTRLMPGRRGQVQSQMRLWAVLAGFFLIGSRSDAQRQDPSQVPCNTISYRVGIEDTIYFRVQLRFRAMEPTVRLFMAENSPGGGREVYARFVEGLRAETESGLPLPVRRTGTSWWTVDTRSRQCTTIRYLVHRHRDDPIRLVSNLLEPGKAYFVGATILVGLERHTHEPAVLTVQPPGELSVWTTLRPEDGTTFRATSYQELAWAPVLIGNARPQEITLAGGKLWLVPLGAPSDSVIPPIVTRFGEITRCQERIFGFLPATRILIGLQWRPDLDYGGGVARRDAVLMNIGREWMPEPARFASGTFAHELFHTWNFGLFYPAESRPWQPLGSTATRAFWLVEGLSNYYVLQTLVRLGRLDVQRALDWIGSEITNLESSPARAWASLEDGGPMTDADAMNGIDVRAGGFVVGFVLDAMIRRDSNGRSSLDDLMRNVALTARQPDYAGYRPEDLVRAVRSVAGDRVAADYRKLVSQAGLPHYGRLLEGTGYRVESVPDSTIGGRRWQVSESPVAASDRAKVSVLRTGCTLAH